MAQLASFHERFQRTEPEEAGTNRGFGLLFAAVFAIVAARPMLHSDGVRWWALAIAAAFLVLTLVRPALLAAPKRLWLRFGAILSRVVNPLVLGLLFLTVVTPTALIARVLGRDPLRLRIDRQAETYWIDRKAAGAAAVDMRKQF